ncbi:hypothetical protein APR41_12035 [Salegentibacter salinarum]|uniref:Glycosyltransferase 2-like domain-containing protein n=1 Tax=Salegentibacter salinarum TaxID=447422 RepID=A0A2N0U2L8_9FLAO|nr:glycosyltransferase family 2 protein [Salegentibacter salinarum]PKD21138.1 hypothetical protein APR41_12035 [Salegentibacter salinarum]SKB76348.1 Glycosyltransferase involved in cell wall bisynthesis [Salegentibacter salinarum]
MQKLVSIIIPTYNRAHLLGETLDSVSAQSYHNWECLIIDDSSTDYTKKLLEFYCEKDSRFQYHQRPTVRPKGANACRNYGFEISEGEFINWFDDDDVMLPGYMESSLKAFKEVHLFIVSKGYYLMNDSAKRIPMKIEIKDSLFKSLVLWESHIITNSVVFRRSFLETKKLFNIKISRGQEAEFFSRIFFNLPESSYKVIKEPQFLYRQHLESKTHKNRAYVRSFKESQAFISMRNLKYSLELKDPDLIVTLYSDIKQLFFMGIEHKHKKNSFYILKNFIPLLWKINKELSIKWLICGSLIFITGKNSYILGKPIRRSEII